MAPFAQLYIDGKFQPSSNAEIFEVCNPYSGEVVSISASASSADCNAAVDAAQRAFETWEHTTLEDRRNILLKAADLIDTNRYREKIEESTRQETAAAPDYCSFNWGSASGHLRAQAKTLDVLKDESYPSVVPGAQVTTQRRAMGVVFLICPWDAPFLLAIMSMTTPILCGNTVIMRGSEMSPWSQSIAAEVFEEAGLPHGVFNFISISKEKIPALTAEIIAHPFVRSIAFTGSDRVGKIIAAEAAKYLKPCVFELGGKSPAVVLDDADVEEAAKAIVYGSMYHSGQVCMSTERVIVQAGIAEALVTAVKCFAASLTSGDVYGDGQVQLGALFTHSAAENVVNMISEAQSDGAQLILGDLRREGGVLQPHLVANVKPGMRLWDRESFGPVTVFNVVNTIDEAVIMANATEYSLSSSLWTGDHYAAPGIASRIRSGYVNINGPTIHFEPVDGLLGLGGASGYGRFHIENFTNKRVVVTHAPGKKYPIPASKV